MATPPLYHSNRTVNLAILAILAVVILHLAVVAIAKRDPWSDEAMLAANLIGQNFDILSPMPYFEQAAPIGYVFLARLVQLLFPTGDPIFLLRLLDVGVFLVGIVALMIHMLRVNRLSDLLMFCAIVLSSSYIWTYASEIKHYSFEFTATSLLLISGWRLAYSDGLTAYMQFAAATVVAVLISFTAPVVIAAVLAAAITIRLIIRFWPRLAGGPPFPTLAYPATGLSPRLIFAGAAALVLAGSFHLLVNRDLAHYQFTAYGFVYESGIFDLGRSIVDNIKIALRLPPILLEPIGVSGMDSYFRAGASNAKLVTAVFAISAFSLLVALLLASARRASYAALALIAFIGGALALNVLGLLPFVSTRHFFFAAPFMLMVLPVGCVELLSMAGSALPGPARRVGGIAVAALLIWTSVDGTIAAANKRSQELSPLLAEIVRTDPNAPVWVYVGAQPAATVLARPELRLTGMFDPRSGEVGWGLRGGGLLVNPDDSNPWQSNPDYPSTILTASGDAKALWLLFAGTWLEPGVDGFLEAAGQAVGACALARAANDTSLYYCSR